MTGFAADQVDERTVAVESGREDAKKSRNEGRSVLFGARNRLQEDGNFCKAVVRNVRN